MDTLHTNENNFDKEFIYMDAKIFYGLVCIIILLAKIFQMVLSNCIGNSIMYHVSLVILIIFVFYTLHKGILRLNFLLKNIGYWNNESSYIKMSLKSTSYLIENVEEIEFYSAGGGLLPERYNLKIKKKGEQIMISSLPASKRGNFRLCELYILFNAIIEKNDSLENYHNDHSKDDVVYFAYRLRDS